MSSWRRSSQCNRLWSRKRVRKPASMLDPSDGFGGGGRSSLLFILITSASVSLATLRSLRGGLRQGPRAGSSDEAKCRGETTSSIVFARVVAMTPAEWSIPPAYVLLATRRSVSTF